MPTFDTAALLRTIGTQHGRAWVETQRATCEAQGIALHRPACFLSKESLWVAFQALAPCLALAPAVRAELLSEEMESLSLRQAFRPYQAAFEASVRATLGPAQED